MTSARVALVGALALVLLADASAQSRSSESPQRFRSRVDLVTITATVVDADGRYVRGLPRDAFEVYEDGQRQALTLFSGERVPIGLGALLDVSDSMRGRRIADARASVSRFLFELLSPDDEFFLMSFNHAPRVIAPWTSRPDDMLPRLTALRPSGGRTRSAHGASRGPASVSAGVSAHGRQARCPYTPTRSPRRACGTGP